MARQPNQHINEFEKELEELIDKQPQTPKPIYGLVLQELLAAAYSVNKRAILKTKKAAESKIGSFISQPVSCRLAGCCRSAGTGHFLRDTTYKRRFLREYPCDERGLLACPD